LPKHFSQTRVQTLIDLLKPTRRTIILDIGANPINVCPYSPLLKMGGCDVWGFEPQQDAFATLLRQKSENEHYLQYAIGDGNPGTLHICKSDGFSSLLPPNIKTLNYLGRWHKAMTVDSKIPIETHRLDDIDDLPQPDLLKIDVQGYETKVFENGTAKLSNVMSVISEVAFVELYENQPLLEEQMVMMKAHGLLLSKFLFLKAKTVGSGFSSQIDWRKHQNQLIDGDAVFVRNLMADQVVTDEQLKHLAICADAVFESFDLTLKCLDLLAQTGAIEPASVLPYAKMIPFPKNTDKS
jgi:FkbM family methyltransferase